MQALNLGVLRKCNKFWNPIYFYLTTISAASREPFVINNVFERLYFRMGFERALNSAENLRIVSVEIYTLRIKRLL